ILSRVLFNDIIVIYDFFFFQAEDGIRDATVTGVQTCALPIWKRHELEDLPPLLLEPLGILLQRADRPLPEIRSNRPAAWGAGTMLMPERLPPQEADERGCPEAAEQKPRHPANAHPGEEREPQRAHNAELHPLLREPRGNGIDQLPV